VSTHGSFTELLRTRAAERSGATAFTYLPDGPEPGDGVALTYRQLDADARRIGSWLQDRGGAGQQVLLLYPQGLGFVSAFAACLYAGAVAVPATLPGDDAKHTGRVAAIIRDANVRIVLTDREHVTRARGWLAAEGLGDIMCRATDDPALGDATAWKEHAPAAEELAFLQYTSGSTGEPKGVMVSHRNLMANVAAISRIVGITADDKVGGWLPQYHDMGLVGQILLPLWAGTSSVLISPVSFLKRPFRWLDVMSRHRITHTAAPSFAYALCVRRVTDAQLATLDLSPLRAACNGAEPVRASVLTAFTQRFAPVGFRRETFLPCYGMAETTLLVSGRPDGTAPVLREAAANALEDNQLRSPRPGEPSHTLVSSGRIIDFDVRIVDPDTRTEQPEGEVGEIWVRGESVTNGYWRRPETTREVFTAELAGTPGGFLRTGDLGALEDGELYVTGRLKEVLVLNGRNLYPQDIERSVQRADPELGSFVGAVFSVDAGGREQIVVIQEVHTDQAGQADGLEELTGRIGRLLRHEHRLPADNIVLVPPGSVARTTSGKIQRTLMRKRFLAGDVVALRAALNTEVERLITAEQAPATRHAAREGVS